MAGTLQTLSIISFAIAGVCLALAVFFWFFFKIPTVIGDLSGRTARKSIARMRATNEKTGVKSYKESKVNVERGKLTDTMPDSGKLKKAKGTEKQETGLLDENKAKAFDSEATGLLDEITAKLDSRETGLLDEATGKLDSEETGLLGEATGNLNSEETGLLVEENETALLNNATNKQIVYPGGKKLEMIEEVMLIHTNEVIG